MGPPPWWWQKRRHNTQISRSRKPLTVPTITACPHSLPPPELGLPVHITGEKPEARGPTARSRFGRAWQLRHVSSYYLDHEIDPSHPQLLSFCLEHSQGPGGRRVVLQGEGHTRTPRLVLAVCTRALLLSALHICLFGIGVSFYAKKIKENDS